MASQPISWLSVPVTNEGLLAAVRGQPDEGWHNIFLLTDAHIAPIESEEIASALKVVGANGVLCLLNYQDLDEPKEHMAHVGLEIEAAQVQSILLAGTHCARVMLFWPNPSRRGCALLAAASVDNSPLQRRVFRSPAVTRAHISGLEPPEPCHRLVAHTKTVLIESTFSAGCYSKLFQGLNLFGDAEVGDCQRAQV